MTQMALDFEPRTRARRTDPATSHAAADAAARFWATQAGKVLDCLRKHGPQGKTNIARRTGLTGVQVDRRLPDLEARGLALPTSQTELSDAGREERIWVATGRNP